MLLGEPPRTQYDLNFSIFGIPVRVHPFFWLVTLMLGSQSPDAASALTWVVAVFLSILVHELGHALVMRAYALRPWITLYGLGGATAYDQAYSSQSKGSAALGQVLISLAGPVAGFLLAAILVLGIYFTAHFQFELNVRFARLIGEMLFICVVWGAVNLLPIYPLDGGQIAREILLKLSPRDGIRLSLWLSIIAAIGMAAFGFAQWRDWLVVFFFGYLAYASYAALTAYSGRRPW